MRLYYHPTCASSYRVIKELHARGLLPRVELVKVSRVAEAGVMGEEVWSVPWISDGGLPLATDPLDPEEAAEIVGSRRARVPDDAAKAFMSAVLGSLYASSLVYVHWSLRPAMSPRFVQAALRSWLGGPDPASSVQSILREEDALLAEYRGKVLRVLSYGIARTLWWSNGGRPPDEPPDEREVAMWLLSTASIGRAGLPDRPQLLGPAARELAEALRADFDRVVRRVDEEQSTIAGDEGYWRLLEGKTA